MATTPQTIEDKIKLADERIAKQQAWSAQLRRIATAESEIPGAYRTGEVSKAKLAEKYGISTMTVSRILADNGIEGNAVRRLNEDERQEVLGMIKAGENLDQIAEAYGISRQAVRGVGLKAGLLKPGERKPHRSDEEYAQIEAFDAEARQRFGSGIYNLGMGLRGWQAKKRSTEKTTVAEQLAEATESAPEPEAAPVEAPVESGLPSVEEAHGVVDAPQAEAETVNEVASDTPPENFKF